MSQETKSAPAWEAEIRQGVGYRLVQGEIHRGGLGEVPERPAYAEATARLRAKQLQVNGEGEWQLETLGEERYVTDRLPLIKTSPKRPLPPVTTFSPPPGARRRVRQRFFLHRKG